MEMKEALELIRKGYTLADLLETEKTYSINNLVEDLENQKVDLPTLLESINDDDYTNLIENIIDTDDQTFNNFINLASVSLNETKDKETLDLLESLFANIEEAEKDDEKKPSRLRKALKLAGIGAALAGGAYGVSRLLKKKPQQTNKIKKTRTVSTKKKTGEKKLVKFTKSIAGKKVGNTPGKPSQKVKPVKSSTGIGSGRKMRKHENVEQPTNNLIDMLFIEQSHLDNIFKSINEDDGQNLAETLDEAACIILESIFEEITAEDMVELINELANSENPECTKAVKYMHDAVLAEGLITEAENDSVKALIAAFTDNLNESYQAIGNSDSRIGIVRAIHTCVALSEAEPLKQGFVRKWGGRLLKGAAIAGGALGAMHLGGKYGGVKGVMAKGKEVGKIGIGKGVELGKKAGAGITGAAGKVKGLFAKK